MPRHLSKTILLILIVSITSAWGVEKRLAGKDEVRARDLFTELRCVVCQNQSIDSSDADVARDLREIVREQISSGKTNEQIRSFLVDRYGEFILLKPGFSWKTSFLWGAPFILLFGGILLAYFANKSRKIEKDSLLSKSEEEDLAKILRG